MAVIFGLRDRIKDSIRCILIRANAVAAKVNVLPNKRTIKKLLLPLYWVLLASFFIPAKLQLLDETDVAKIEQSLGDEVPDDAEFAQEVRKLTP